MLDTVAKLGEDPGIKAIIVNSAVPGTNEAFKKLRETRKDIFVVYCNLYLSSGYKSGQTAFDLTQTADLILETDVLGTGPAMVQQAQRMGAETFVHYSFERHMSESKNPCFLERRELIKQECDKLGVEFIDAAAIDVMDSGSLIDTRQFFLEDVPKMIEKHGENTAFFYTDTLMTYALVIAVVENGGIYTNPTCFLTQISGVPQALNIGFSENSNDFERFTEDTKRVLAEKGAA